MAQAAPVAKVGHKAVIEKTMRVNRDGKERLECVHIETPDDEHLKTLVDRRERVHISITTLDGEPVHGFTASAVSARETMKACLAGTYKPMPKVRNKKNETAPPMGGA